MFLSATSKLVFSRSQSLQKRSQKICLYKVMADKFNSFSNTFWETYPNSWSKEDFNKLRVNILELLATIFISRIFGHNRFYSLCTFFSCESSSIGRNVGLSVCLSVCQSVRNEFYRSVMLLVVYIWCQYYCSLDYLIIP